MGQGAWPRLGTKGRDGPHDETTLARGVARALGKASLGCARLVQGDLLIAITRYGDVRTDALPAYAGSVISPQAVSAKARLGSPRRAGRSENRGVQLASPDAARGTEIAMPRVGYPSSIREL